MSEMMSEMMTEQTSLLACPRCDQPLEGWQCRACQVAFPVHDGIPWLFADPGAAITEWQNRWQHALARIDADRQSVRSALKGQLSAPTRRRLDALAQGYAEHRAQLDAILAPLKLSQGSRLDTHLALRTRLPGTQGILSYDANVHRDWCWGESENEAALSEVTAVLNGTSASRVLILGAGAGRLAYDLHRTLQPALTVAMDLNPLLAYVGHRVCLGEVVELTEFPLAPLTPEQGAIKRRLQAPEPAGTGLQFVLADVMRPPFQPGSFDLVITPWLLDVIEGGAAPVLARINHLLIDGGTWVNHGSVAFQSPDPALRLTLEELGCLATEMGFQTTTGREASLPYMNCPDSRHGRIETVSTSSARKVETLQKPEKHRALPDWIVTGKCPVPALSSFQNQAMSTRIHAFIMSLIDGRRSLKDMAREMEAQQLMTRQEGEEALRGFLTKMYDEAGRSSAL